MGSYSCVSKNVEPFRTRTAMALESRPLEISGGSNERFPGSRPQDSRQDWPQSTLRLKDKFQRELEFPRGRRRRNLPGRLAVAASLENDIVRVKEIGVIEDVEGFCPELHIHFLVDG